MLWAISINKIQNIHIWAGIDTLKFQDMYLWNKTYIWLVGDVFSSRVAKQSSVLGNSVVLFGVFFKNHDRPLEIRMTPCWSVLEFCKIRLEKSSSKNWIFSLQKSILKLIFAAYTGSKNPVWKRLKIQFIELDFSKWIFQKSNIDQQVCLV